MSDTAERWRDVRRARLLEAAGRVFAREGFEAASVGGIAFEAGIGKPTLYRYFPGKDALFEAVFSQALDDLEARLDAVLATEPAFEARLRAMLAEIMPTFRTHLASLSSLDTPGSGTAKRRVFGQRRTAIERRLVQAFAAAETEGTIRAIPAEVLARMMIGMVRSSANTTAISDETAVATILDVVLNGVRPRS